MAGTRVVRTLLLLSFVALSVPYAFAQQTGSVSGKVTAVDGAALPGVTVEARSNVLPQPRVTVSNEAGEYRLPQLQPGRYSLTYSLAGLQTVTRNVEVLLHQNSTVDVALGMQGLAESITVTAEATLVDRSSAELQSGLSNEQIEALPIAQEYRDLQKLIPGVMVSQEQVRGPSAGGSGQDNVYQFDGVNVTMPLFGVQVAEPSTHDIAQFSVLKGGAKAIDFERAGGFSVDSVSKSGTNEYSGMVSYQVLNSSFIADQESTVDSRFEQDRSWATVNFGGPVLRDRLFFYGSYYRPEFTKDNQANLYGDLPSYKNEREEMFGKLTFTPMSSVLINGSYRDSSREEIGAEFSSNQAASTAFGYKTDLSIATVEGSWIVNPQAFATFTFTDFQNPGGGRPANFAGVTPSLAVGTQLDLASLDQLGRLTVPTAISTNPTQSAFVQPYIDRYGYVDGGARKGGGLVGFSSLSADDDDFYRKNGQVGFNYSLGGDIAHDLHFGYQRYIDEEDRFQTSNGWGAISIPGGTVNCPAAACGSAKPAFFLATLSQQTTGVVPTIHSELHSQSIELNDTIRMNNWTFSVGLMASNDTFYGQGLREADNVAGWVADPGNKYEMYDIGFEKMIQPRASATWAYNGSDTVYASYAKYNPAPSSLPRAASWDRNLVASINAYFDESGKLMGIDPVRSSSGKLFVEDLDPRYTDEYMIGTGQQITPTWSARAYGRYRYSSNFWEDTNNDARIRFGAGVEGVKQELYIPDLAARRAAIGSGSSYVIAELDGAFTKYYEATMETDYRLNNTFVRGSYTWSHYYGNFDQDNTSFNTANDTSIFVGSSNIADGAGRQLWNNKYGDLRGDRRHVLKVYGTQMLPWNASLGAFAVYQSGQPYQLESYLPYRALTTSTSETNRYAEPAGRRRSPAHHQLDLNYTQNVPLPRGLNLQFLIDVFNLYDKQTGYDYETRVSVLGACSGENCIDTGIAEQPRINSPFAKSFYDPRRFQIAARLQF
jgi:hypothetical protein